MPLGIPKKADGRVNRNKVDLTRVLGFHPKEVHMNSLQQHHRGLIRFSYSCFDRIICNGSVLQFVHTKRAGSIIWFLRTHRQVKQINRACLTKISGAYHDWLESYVQEAGIDIVEPEGDVRREDLVQPYYRQLGRRSGVAVILRAREPERMVVHFAKSNQVAVECRHVNLYYFYLQDAQCGRMFVRICPYFPFNIRVWLNGHNWLAGRLRQENIAFEQRDNLFVACANPQRLQELADAFAPQDIQGPVETWLKQLLPF